MMVLTCAALAALNMINAPGSGLEHLGAPCKAKNVLAGRLVMDRITGREWLVLSNMNENSGAELIFIDFENNTGKSYHAPAGAGAWALCEVPGDRLVVGTFYDGTFMVFDLKKMEFVKTAKFPGESYIWDLAIGSDGRVYGGTYGGGKLGALDLNTYEVEDLGNPAPPNLYLRNVSATPDGRILCSLGMEKPTTLLFDPKTKKFEPVPKHLEGVSQGVSWNGCFLAGSRAFSGTDLQPVPAPFPLPPDEKGAWSVNSYATTSDTLVLEQGKSIYLYRKGDEALTKVAEIDLRSGRPLAVSKKGWILGVRGQDYYVIKPGDDKLMLRPIPVESGPRQTHFLKVDPKGRLWGGPTFGQTLFYLDPKTKRAVNTSNICDAGGEVYDVAFLGGKTYAAAYAGGDIICYDPEKPWDQWNQKNPRNLADVGDRGYIRPTGGIMVGPGGKLYSGWMARYGKYGGAIAITDPDTGKTDLIENPLGEQAIAGLSVDDRFAYIGTSLAANGLPNKKGESPRFGVIDLQSSKVVFEQPFEGAAGVRVLAYDRTTKRIAVSVDRRIRIFDAGKRAFVEGLPKDIPPITCNSVGATGGGRLYYASDTAIVALDLADCKSEQLATAPGNASNVAVGPDGTVYFSCGVDVYALR